ncbi:protein NEN1-like isoform X2 [Tasmannia lanceolata]|uniref:protein NEN1-like isoform X2 n=1 Tax=Tasmannia lanceolata TaxID=3420 RepID=UPI004064C20F
MESSSIAFFDVETTVPSRTGQGFTMLEFGAILVCPRKLEELESYSTLIKPPHLLSVSPASVKCNGITREAVSVAPTFQQVADKIYEILHGRIWAGHNIVRFDCARIREAFAEIGRPPPEPKGTIDSLSLLTQRFGRRAGDMKLATLATYFRLGQQKHRSLDDVRMNLEVLKSCATVLFLESSLPDILTANSWISPNATTRSRSNGKTSLEGTSRDPNSPSALLRFADHQMTSLANGETGEEVLTAAESNSTVPNTDPVDLTNLIDQMKIDPVQPDAMGPVLPLGHRSGIGQNEVSTDATMVVSPMPELPHMSSGGPLASEACSSYSGFLDPDEVVMHSISASLIPAYRGVSKIRLLHKDVLLQLCCMKLEVRFGVSSKFSDYAGRPRLSIVVDSPPSLCQILDTCDHLAQKLSLDSGSSSEWRPVVIRKNGFSNSSAIRLHIPTVGNGNMAIYSTEIYQKEASGNTQKLDFSRIDAAELNSLFIPGTFVDVYFSLDVYDYQQNAGIRLVAKRLIIHSK